MNYNNLTVETNNKIQVIKINRPEKLNALNNQTLSELKSVLEEIHLNDSVKVVIITGSGEKAFVAGADIEEINRLDVDSAKQFSEFGQSVFNKIENLNKPVIAAVNGYALGGGCELAIACHIRFASAKAKFGQPEIKLGIIPGYGGTQRLSRLIGTAKSLELMLTGDMINADDAMKLGLVNQVFPPEELITKTLEFAEKVSNMSSVIIKNILKAVAKGTKLNFGEALKLEAGLFAECCGTFDFKEGTDAFLQKRPPHFEDK
jgi:enoyl-CoA hydratase